MSQRAIPVSRSKFAMVGKLFPVGVWMLIRNAATSNDAWGPTGTEMTDIAQMTFNG